MKTVDRRSGQGEDMSKKVWMLACLMTLGCAHQVEKDKVVQFPFAPELLQKILKEKPLRLPASKVSSFLEIKEGKSSRRVYFTTLYYQQRALGQYLERDNSVSVCPQFHHDKLEADAYPLPKVISKHDEEIDDAGKVYFPELVFNSPFSLTDYHSLLEQEVSELCEYGYSDNFYKFDNLITYYSHKEDFHNKTTAMESVLKIPIFANFYLLKMMGPAHEVVFEHPETKAFIELSATHWFDRYVAEAQRVRDHFLPNKMVRR